MIYVHNYLDKRIWKDGNRMNRTFISIISIVLLLCLFGCGSAKKSIFIVGTPDTYSPLSSAVRGIQLSVSNSTASDEIEYRWKATGGTFFNKVDGIAVVEYTGNTAFWSCSLDEKNKCYAGDNTTINVIAYNTKTGNAIACGSIEINKNNTTYKIDE